MTSRWRQSAFPSASAAWRSFEPPDNWLEKAYGSSLNGCAFVAERNALGKDVVNVTRPERAAPKGFSQGSPRDLECPFRARNPWRTNTERVGLGAALREIRSNQSICVHLHLRALHLRVMCPAFGRGVTGLDILSRPAFGLRAAFPEIRRFSARTPVF